MQRTALREGRRSPARITSLPARSSPPRSRTCSKSVRYSMPEARIAGESRWRPAAAAARSAGRRARRPSPARRRSRGVSRRALRARAGCRGGPASPGKRCALREAGATRTRATPPRIARGGIARARDCDAPCRTRGTARSRRGNARSPARSRRGLVMQVPEVVMRSAWRGSSSSRAGIPRRPHEPPSACSQFARSSTPPQTAAVEVRGAEGPFRFFELAAVLRGRAQQVPGSGSDGRVRCALGRGARLLGAAELPQAEREGWTRPPRTPVCAASAARRSSTPSAIVLPGSGHSGVYFFFRQ